MDKKVQVSAKMTSKNQITVPKSVRQTLGLKENQKVILNSRLKMNLKGLVKKQLWLMKTFGTMSWL